MRMELKPDIKRALSQEEQWRVVEALRELAAINEVRTRFRTTQLKNALLIKSQEDMDE